jgi:hypothetical protein
VRGHHSATADLKKPEIVTMAYGKAHAKAALTINDAISFVCDVVYTHIPQNTNRILREPRCAVY